VECPFGADGELDRLGLRAGHALDEAQEGLGIGHVGEVAFAVGGGQFQLVTICNQLTSFLLQTVFQHFPVALGGLVIRLLRQHPDDVHNGEKPRLGLLVVDAADFVPLKNGEVLFHNVGVSFSW